MRKLWILLWFSLIPLTMISQDSTSVSFSKGVALLCIDHKRLLQENSLFEQKILELERLNNLYLKTDSLRTNEIILYKNKSISDDATIKRLKKSKKRTIICSTIVGAALLTLISIYK